MTVTPERFRAQMKRLVRTGVVGLDEVLAGKPGVAITFDDGFKDCMEFALPVLKEFGLRAAFFIVAGRVGGVDTWMRVTPLPEERLMDWDDLKRLQDAGMTIGSHSMTHGTMTPAEIGDSKRVLEENLGTRVEHFAYPRGEFTPESVEWVRQAGYRAAWSTKDGDQGTFTRKRLPVSANTTTIGFWAKLVKARLGYY
jgi:peptidoglycan/xylan/chitin deacetylase (PgdA/CDA1 family)